MCLRESLADVLAAVGRHVGEDQSGRRMLGDEDLTPMVAVAQDRLDRPDVYRALSMSSRGHRATCVSLDVIGLKRACDCGAEP
jgi:hypothetical protein